MKKYKIIKIKIKIKIKMIRGLGSENDE